MRNPLEQWDLWRWMHTGEGLRFCDRLSIAMIAFTILAGSGVRLGVL